MLASSPSINFAEIRNLASITLRFGWAAAHFAGVTSRHSIFSGTSNVTRVVSSAPAGSAAPRAQVPSQATTNVRYRAGKCMRHLEGNQSEPNGDPGTTLLELPFDTKILTGRRPRKVAGKIAKFAVRQNSDLALGALCGGPAKSGVTFCRNER